MAISYIGGILSHARGMSLVVAPLVNSYKRLVPHYEAPVYVAWGFQNRSALVRVPRYPEGMDKTARIEYRHPDPSSNPYLAAVSMINAGMDGIKNKIDTPEPHFDNLYEFSEAELDKMNIDMLPEHLGEAIDCFVKDPVITEALGSYLTKSLVRLKTKEFEEYNKHTGKTWEESRPEITKWELERYLVRA